MLDCVVQVETDRGCECIESIFEVDTGAAMVDVVAIDNWSAAERDGHVRDAFAAELVQRLSEFGVRASLGESRDFGYSRQPHLLHGTFVCSQEVLYINVSLSNPQSRRAAFTETYQDDRDLTLKLARTVADDIREFLIHAARFA